MNVFEWAEQILIGGSLEDKLVSPERIEFSHVIKKAKVPSLPHRESAINFSQKRVKFPKASSLHDREKRVIALHSFANHELMAIEIFAAFILLFPVEKEFFQPYQKQLVQTLKEEQLHFSLYKKHIEELGGHFGDYPVNDFFWKLIRDVKSPEQFFAIVSLSLEAANLDFSKFYSKVFYDIEDFDAAKIMDRIYKDEIRHVALGRKYIEYSYQEEEILWSQYEELLPNSFSPARSKGIVFDMAGRKKAGLSDSYIQQAENYRSDFNIVNRKAWK